MQLVLDAKKTKSQRMFFLSEENRNVLNNSLTLEKNVQFCKRFNVYLKVRWIICCLQYTNDRNTDLYSHDSRTTLETN